MVNAHDKTLQRRGEGLGKVLVLYVFCTFLLLAVTTMTLSWGPGGYVADLGSAHLEPSSATVVAMDWQYLPNPPPLRLPRVASPRLGHPHLPEEMGRGPLGPVSSSLWSRHLAALG